MKPPLPADRAATWRNIFLVATLLPLSLPPALSQTTSPVTERIAEAPGRMEWMHDMQVVLGIGFGFPKSELKLDQWMADCDFEFVDWCLPGQLNDADHLRTRYGVGASGADQQWSEFHSFEISKIGTVDRETFLNEVVCADINGKPTMDKYKGALVPKPRWSACANRPRWKEFKLDRNTGLLRHFSGVNVDVMRAWGHGQGFCTDCQRVFRDHLRTHHSPAELQALGVDDVDTFDMVAYLKERHPGKASAVWLDDPLVRSYIRVQTIAQLGHLRDFSTAMHAGGAKLGRGMPVFGNTGHLLWAEANDMIELEIDPSTDYYGYPDSRKGCARIKLGLAFGRYEQPVWIRGYPRILDGRADYERGFQDLIYGEAFANGGVRVFNLTHEDARPDPVFEQRGYFYRRFIDYSRLIQEHRAAFQDRDNAAEVALVYSLPTEWYENGGPFKFGNSEHQTRVQTWAKALDESHLPYEMVVFGHPEFHPDREDLLARLKRYRAVVLPAATCLTEAQAAAVRRYVEQGGNLVWSGRLGTFNENREPRETAPLADLPSAQWKRLSPGAGRVAGLGDHDLAYGTAVNEARKLDPEAFYRLKASVLWALGGERQIVSTDASPETQFNLWLARNRRSASLHLVNYGIDLHRDHAVPQHDLRVQLRLPAELEKFDRVTLVAPGEPDRELPFTRDDGLVTFNIPKLNVWAMVVFSSGQEQEAASALANVRKALRRREILKNDHHALLPRYESVFALYQQRDYAAALAQATALCSESETRNQ